MQLLDCQASVQKTLVESEVLARSQLEKAATLVDAEIDLTTDIAVLSNGLVSETHGQDAEPTMLEELESLHRSLGIF